MTQQNPFREEPPHDLPHLRIDEVDNVSARPVLVGIDGSADSRRALCLAGQIADRIDAELHVLHAVGLTERIDGQTMASHGHSDEIAEQFASWCEAVRTVGVDEWVARLDHGAPVATMLRVAKEIDAGVIVLGRHGSGQRPERLLGSTAHQVAERSVCPVLVVPPVGRAERPDAT